MQLNYRQILENAFRSNIPDWDKISEFDPMRVFFDSIEKSLVEIEKRQNRFANVVLDSLPGLLSFKAKEGRLGRAILKLNGHEGKAGSFIDAGTLMEFENGQSAIMAELVGKSRLQGVREVAREARGNCLSLRGSNSETTRQLSLNYFSTRSHSNLLRGVALRVLSGSREQVYFQPDVQVVDGTHGFRISGDLDLILHKAELKAGEEFEVELEFEHPFEGFLGFNLVCAELFQLHEEQLLARMVGLPWEEVVLPHACVKVPERLQLRFPDDRTLELTRMESEVLKHRLVSPEGFRQGFFYNPSTHSVILPEADFLLGDYPGGAEIRIPSMKSLVEELPAPDSTVHFDSVADRVESVSIEGWERRPEYRERPELYLERFYNLFRSFQSGQAVTPLVREADLEHRLTQAFETVRRVEVSENESLLEVHVLCGENEEMSEKMRESLGRVVEKSLPIFKNFRIYGFKTVPLSVDARIEVNLSPARAGIFSRDWINEGVRRALNSILSDLYYLAPERKMTQEELTSKLRLRLCSGTGAFSLEANEIISLSLLFKDESGVYGTELLREKGKCFEVSVDTQCDLQMSSERRMNAVV